MKFKGTKGKWNVLICDTNNETKEIAFITNENHDSLPTDLTIRSSYNVEAKEVQRANYLLISKAPEMLEMLIEVIETKADSDYDKIKQLIKEATEL